ncbi:Zn(II)2Cys6 transcription factor [Aspergillus steynii IBT 23096]|uniref:Zn(II)2Cys6 transcription factor n=1 Tax=Aspergillus steynii IBT 23096 TaxID=1392250 RepID=A0A2I2GCK5_9EURO|nr:Zn(II)2Cys6 transcription factor [Aspergillus steynii IBT 23096]PLB50613.1 Zn(II)2Cys6 transcription factor [Aspergillus steynii IBT 23096]
MTLTHRSRGMEASRRIKKRSSNACQRCRRQKIKCSGSQPCNTCNKRKLTCTFDDREQKVLVTRGYIEDLQARVAQLERGDEIFSPQSHEADPIPDDETILTEPPNIETTDLTNPLSTGPSTFMTSVTGRVFYLGTSSNWSFARKILSMTHEHLYQSPLPTGSLRFDAATYDLGWDGMRLSMPELPMAPTLDFSLYLITAVKFHAGQLFHLFDEESFMGGLYAFHEDPHQQMATSGLWYIHYLLILAFGKAFVVQKAQDGRPPGYEFFIKALQLLPDTTRLSRDPIIATEILCCIALYLHSMDYRNSAYDFIGQALRIALAQGMHTNMPEDLGYACVQRCRRIWWTIYVLDRQMTSLMGLPQSIQDDQVYDLMPSYPGSPQRAAALSMQIKMCQIIAEINRTVYGPDGRLNRKFLVRTKAALASTADLANELRQSHDLRLEEASISGVSRLSAHLHLLYHQCIVLATRPLLFCSLKIRLQSPDRCMALQSSPTVRRLLQVCLDSAQQMLNILASLHEQNLLDSFLPFDLESTFVSSVILLAAGPATAGLLDPGPSWVERGTPILDEMVTRGNRIAAYNRSELEQLRGMLGQLDDKTISQGGMPSPQIECGMPEGLTTAEILAVAESIDTGDVDWIAHAVTENSIW